MIASKFQLPFVKKEQLSEDVYTFYFDRKPFKFNYFAGQYFRVTLPIDNPDGRGSSRYFTISSSPHEEFLTITTRIIKSSFKLQFNGLKLGDSMTFFGPFGDFYQDKKDLTPKILLAGGIGITPAHSMLRFIDNQKVKVNVTLLVSFSAKSEAIFYDELKGIEKRNEGVRVIYSLTKEEKLVPGFEKGRIDEEKIRKYAPNIESSKFFLGGSPAFVESMKKVIKIMGVLEDDMVVGDFSGY